MLPATHQYPFPCPVLMLAEGLGTKPDVSSTAEGWQWGPPHTPRADELLPAVLPEGQVCSSACSHVTAELQVMQTAECAGAWSLRGCVTAEMQGRADPKPLCGTSVADIAGIIQQVKIMLLLRLTEGDVM